MAASNFLNILTANYEYSRSDMKNLPLPIQTQIYKKLEISCNNFIAFLVSALHF